MAIIVKILQNSEQDACVKVKADSSGGTAKITKEMLCYRPKLHSCTPSTDSVDRFQDFDEKSIMTIRTMQWSGYTQEGGSGRIYRGDTLDLEHQIMSFCVGDTCQYEFLGQEMVADREYDLDDFTVELAGEMTLWIKLRKQNFKNYSGETAYYGVYEDDTRLGPKEQYQQQLEQAFGDKP